MDVLDMAGLLYVVATPIGNLEDLGRRAVNILASVATIAAEDTRRTRVLLEAIGVAGVELLALHSHNESAASGAVLRRLREGCTVALVSDAGTPLLCDPGYELVRACWEEGIEVRPIPGASAVTALLSVSPLPGAHYRFEGFLPSRPGARDARLRELLELDEPSVFFEAPHRMASTLDDLARLAPQRRMLVGREMTKLHEQYLCASAGELLVELRAADRLRGEFVCVLEAAPGASRPRDARRTMEILGRELAPAQAARLGAQLLDLPKRELYQLAMTLRQE